MARKVGIVAKPREEAVALAAELKAWLGGRDVDVVVDGSTAQALGVRAASPWEMRECELLLVLGGDGTLIHAAQILEGARVPLFGINLGRLGFLTEISRTADIYDLLERALRGETPIEERMMLRAELVREERTVFEGFVLNDAVVSKAALARIADLVCWVDGHRVTHFRADGLIVATPTGSTAYNLAAGGPILYPTQRAVVLTPICPHTLTQRPLVLPHVFEIRIELTSNNGEMFLTLDGQRGTAMEAGDVVAIRECDEKVWLVRSPEMDFFSILSRKLGWG